jgi:hypothetical protein
MNPALGDLKKPAAIIGNQMATGFRGIAVLAVNIAFHQQHSMSAIGKKSVKRTFKSINF